MKIRAKRSFPQPSMKEREWVLMGFVIVVIIVCVMTICMLPTAPPALTYDQVINHYSTSMIK